MKKQDRLDSERAKTQKAKSERRAHRIQGRQALRAQRAASPPKPAPRARSYFVQEIWEKLRLDEGLARVGIHKDGIPISSILMVVLMMGIMGVSSLHALSQALPQDEALLALLNLPGLEMKQLYRGLAQISIGEYQAWMVEAIRVLQIDARTASRPDGVVAGDTTQIIKAYAHKIPGVHVLFHHSEKRFVKGVEVLNTHYADSDKDYPLFMSFYEPDEEAAATRAALRARQAAGVDGRKPREVLAYLKAEKAAGNPPELVVLSGPRLSAAFRCGLDKAQIMWLGVSNQRRTYTLAGQEESISTKKLLGQSEPKYWAIDPDLGYRFATLGLAHSAIGELSLVLAEHMADGVRTLYLLSPETTHDEALRRITLVLEREQRQQAHAEHNLLHQMLHLLRLSRDADIRAETAVFDRFFLVPWFMQAVCALGFARVVTKAKANFNYTYQGQNYSLPQLWTLLAEEDFDAHTYKGRHYLLASLSVQMATLGSVKLVFLRQTTRRGNRILDAVLLCSDPDYPDDKVLRAYLLRWRIEVCYREVKQNHAFGQFHSQTLETNYGQTLLSLLAYLFLSLLRRIVPPLRERSLGWILQHYLNAVVSLSTVHDSENVLYSIALPPWIFDHHALPDWLAFLQPDSSTS